MMKPTKIALTAFLMVLNVCSAKHTWAALSANFAKYGGRFVKEAVLTTKVKMVCPGCETKFYGAAIDWEDRMEQHLNKRGCDQKCLEEFASFVDNIKLKEEETLIRRGQKIGWSMTTRR